MTKAEVKSVQNKYVISTFSQRTDDACGMYMDNVVQVVFGQCSCHIERLSAGAVFRRRINAVTLLGRRTTATLH